MAIVYQDGEPGKLCTKCGEWRPVARYPRRSISLDGYDSICRECRNVASQAWRAKNKERVQELNREYYEANRDERLEYHRTYRNANKEYFAEQMRKFRQNNPEYHARVMREWSQRHPDKVRERDRARRARKLGNGGTFTHQEWEAIKQRYNYICLRCGRREPDIKLTVDHIMPLIKGGRHSAENIQPLCKSCNSAKHDDAIDYRPDQV